MFSERTFLIAQCRISLAYILVSCTFAQGPSDANEAKTQASTQQPALQERYPRYRVMASDVLAITFPLSPEINQNVTVQPDGFITLANVGSVYVQGQTTPEVAHTLTKAFAKVLHNPIIGVDVTNFQSPQFTILGQVGKPGQYPLRYDSTVSQAIAIGGGFLPSAKTQAFLLHRVSEDWVEVKKLNIQDIVHGKKVTEDIHLQPGDMIFVPETVIAKFRKYLPYNTGVGVNPLAIANSF
jgi:polysaccharide biosynthesis/export protein